MPRGQGSRQRKGQHRAYAKSHFEGDDTEEVLRAFQDVYEMRVAEHGEGDEFTIRAGEILAVALQRANRGDLKK